ncbi:CHAT domain-containing protein [Oscillochloris sp. ZM17-4]|uniref:CHAT domain-containing protein n=1 Tax=Oscillochloris sp. ZM17-4 TaxID=2866714 RepID=UPI001C72AD32|nr:CHAT domain-containing protein [Oscillochloris sp. ZM17-4]MBX0328224.1 CHAT domain-containing protein [Oscillochloris sp. ZM17-4]
MAGLADLIARRIEQLAAGDDQEEPIIWLWGSQGVGKTHWLREVEFHALDKNLQTVWIDLPAAPSHPDDYAAGQEQLRRALERMIDGPAFRGQRKVLIIDDAPGSDGQKAISREVFDLLVPLTRPPYKGQVIAFLSSIWPFRVDLLSRATPELRTQIKSIQIPLCDPEGTENQLRYLIAKNKVRASIRSLHTHIHYLTFGLPFGNECIATFFTQESTQDSAHEWRKRELALVEHLVQEMRAKLEQKVEFNEAIYQRIREMAVYRYFDEDTLSAMDESYSHGFGDLISMMRATGIVRYEKKINSNEVVAPLRRLLVRHWSITDREGFFNHCELALQIYEWRLNEDLQDSQIGKEAIAARLRGELLLLARIYRCYDSPDEKINFVLRERCTQRLRAIYTGPESLGTARLLADQIKNEEELFCFRDELASNIERFIEQRTKVRLDIVIEESQRVLATWKAAREAERSYEKPIRADDVVKVIELFDAGVAAGDMGDRIDQVGTLIRTDLIPDATAQIIQEAGNALEISVTGASVPYELMRSGESFLCLTHSIGRALPQSQWASDEHLPGYHSAPPTPLKALLVTLGARDDPMASSLETEIAQIAPVLSARRVICDTEQFPSRPRLLELFSRQKYRLIYLAGPVTAEYSADEHRVVASLMCADGRAARLHDVGSYLTKQRPLVFINGVHQPRPGGSLDTQPSTTGKMQLLDGKELQPFKLLLLGLMDESLNDNELKTLCGFYLLGVDYENLSGDGKLAKMQVLIDHLERRRALADLLDALEKMREDMHAPVGKLRDQLRAHTSSPLSGVDVGAEVLRSGANHCLVNQWNTTPESATEFAVKFFTHLMTGQMIGESVRLARHDLQLRAAPDAAWAAYVLYGDPMQTMRPPRDDEGRL